MNATFGARLRAHREDQQISLATIAAATKIKVSLLEALEADDASHWPKGIFGRSYLRDYARAINLDADAVIREFYELHPDPITPLTPSILTPPVAAPQESSLRRLFSSVMPGLRPRMAEMTASAATPDTQPVGYPGDGISPATPTVAPVLDAAADDEADLPLAPPPPPSPIPAVPAVSADVIVRLSAIANLCMRLGRAAEWREVEGVLEEVAGVLDASGVILWSWEPRANVLRPVLAHGYSRQMLSKMALARADDDNPLAAAFRAGNPCIVEGDVHDNGAVLVPLVAPRGRVGMLSLELRRGAECRESVRAFSMLLAAQLVTLVDVQALSHAESA